MVWYCTAHTAHALLTETLEVLILWVAFCALITFGNDIRVSKLTQQRPVGYMRIFTDPPSSGEPNPSSEHRSDSSHTGPAVGSRRTPRPGLLGNEPGPLGIQSTMLPYRSMSPVPAALLPDVVPPRLPPPAFYMGPTVCNYQVFNWLLIVRVEIRAQQV